MAINSTPAEPSPHLPSNTIDEDKDIVAYNDTLARLQALQARWAYKDIEEDALVKDALQACQRSRYESPSQITMMNPHSGGHDLLVCSYFQFWVLCM